MHFVLKGDGTALQEGLVEGDHDDEFGAVTALRGLFPERRAVQIISHIIHDRKGVPGLQ